MNENLAKEIIQKFEVTVNYAVVLQILETLKMAVSESLSNSNFNYTGIYGFKTSPWDALSLINTLSFLIRAMEEMSKKTEESKK